MLSIVVFVAVYAAVDPYAAFFGNSYGIILVCGSEAMVELVLLAFVYLLCHIEHLLNYLHFI